MDQKSWRWKSTAGLADSLLAIRSPPTADYAGVRPLVAELAQLVPETVGAGQQPVAACLTALRRLEEDMLNLLREAAETVLGRNKFVFSKGRRTYKMKARSINNQVLSRFFLFYGLNPFAWINDLKHKHRSINE